MDIEVATSLLNELETANGNLGPDALYIRTDGEGVELRILDDGDAKSSESIDCGLMRPGFSSNGSCFKAAMGIESLGE